METQQEQQPNHDQRQQYREDQTQTTQRQEFEPSRQRQQPQTQTLEQGTARENSGLVGGQEMKRFAAQWTSVQAAFVDEPRKAVEQADKLVEEVIQHLARTFADERHNLEGQWSRGDQVSTEDLRVALQRYRQFFQSLLRT